MGQRLERHLQAEALAEAEIKRFLAQHLTTQRKSLGRPRINKELEDWVIRMAKDNRSWGYAPIRS